MTQNTKPLHGEDHEAILRELEREKAARRPSHLISPEEAKVLVAEWDREFEEKKRTFDALPVDDRIASTRRDLEAARKVVTDGPPKPDADVLCLWNPTLNGLRCRELEIALLELEGASPEIIWVARSQTYDGVRTGRFPSIPTHEEALRVIQAGDVYYDCQPECLRDRAEPRTEWNVSYSAKEPQPTGYAPVDAYKAPARNAPARRRRMPGELQNAEDYGGGDRPEPGSYEPMYH